MSLKIDDFEFYPEEIKTLKEAISWVEYYLNKQK